MITLHFRQPVKCSSRLKQISAQIQIETNFCADETESYRKLIFMSCFYALVLSSLRGLLLLGCSKVRKIPKKSDFFQLQVRFDVQV